MERLDAIVYTHSHADHILGLDDIRPFNFKQGSKIPLYASAPTFDTIKRVFSYAFDNRERKTHVPKLEVNVIDEQGFDVLGLRFVPIPVLHGTEVIFGFRLGKFAYLTDHSEFPTVDGVLQGLDVLFLDALRHKPHPTHSTVSESVAMAQTLAPRPPTSHISATICRMRRRRRRCQRASIWLTTGCGSKSPTAHECLSFPAEIPARSGLLLSPSATSTGCMWGIGRSCGGCCEIARADGLHAVC